MAQKEITTHWLTLEDLEQLLKSNDSIRLGEDVVEKIKNCRAYLDQKIATGDQVIYGINTGFGSLCDTVVQPNELEALQRNLVLSHACGTGELLPYHLVRRIILLKILGLSKGNSGVALETVERLIFFYNERIYPLIYTQGSLGASGDLAPLAHLSLALLGEGKVWYNGVVQETQEVLELFGLKPIVLRSKEGLALLNGTQFMSACASYAVAAARQIERNYRRIAAMSIDAYDCRLNPLDPRIQDIRHHEGQKVVAASILNHLEGSEIAKQSKKQVQDAYSFRCIPQVHGASLDGIEFIASVVEKEINAVTDNPTIFDQDDEVISAGNFHGQPLAVNMDYLAILIAELGSISERRIYKLISGNRELPPFLVASPGLNSGFMILQYSAASIVSQNKQYCTPASVDTIDSSNGQEDHVSMGANAATKLLKVVDNVFQVQGLELMTAAQALDFRRPAQSSVTVEDLHSTYRSKVPFLKKDELMSDYMLASAHFVKNLQ